MLSTFAGSSQIKDVLDVDDELTTVHLKDPGSMTILMERPIVRHICPVCGKDMRQKNELQRHLRVHSGERPFVCNICQKGFTRKDSLKKHLYLVHKQTH